MALFAVPSPVAFFRSLLSRKALPAVVAPAPFEGTITVVSPPVRGALPKPALVTPYAGHRPTVTRGARGRFVSVKAGVLAVARSYVVAFLRDEGTDPEFIARPERPEIVRGTYAEAHAEAERISPTDTAPRADGIHTVTITEVDSETGKEKRVLSRSFFPTSKAFGPAHWDVRSVAFIVPRD